MTIAPAPSTTFEPLCAAAGDELAATALAAASQAAEWLGNGILIVVVRPERDDHRILTAEGTGVLRAAVSVAVASGNHRLWTDAPVDGTVERPTRQLPEVVSAAADASGVVAAHIGAVRVDGSLEGVAIWFESGAGVASMTDRRHTLQLLSAAAERDAERWHAESEADGPAQSPVQASCETSADEARQFDPDDPDLDAVTGLTSRECFERALELYESDHATLVVVDIDHFDSIANEYGADIADRVLFDVADRLLDECRKSDLVARIDTDTFAILFDDAERSSALRVTKRLLARVAQPLALASGPESITATIAMSHQFGLVDTDELMESATDALNSGKRSARGRLTLGT